MRKYKSSPKGKGATTKSVHLYIDEELMIVLREQENKTRFVNNAIRAYCKKIGVKIFTAKKKLLPLRRC